MEELRSSREGVELLVQGRRIKSTEELVLVETRTPSTAGLENVEISTEAGKVLVTILGDRTKPSILSYHDIGVNFTTCFASLLKNDKFDYLVNEFCWYNISAPGQYDSEDATGSYPSMNGLAVQVREVAEYFEIKNAFGVGVGLGANVLARFAMLYPGCVNGLVLINLLPFQPTTNLEIPVLSDKILKWKLEHAPRYSWWLTRLLDKLLGGTNEICETLQSYQDRCLLQNSMNLQALAIEYLKRSSISEEMGQLLDCKCLLISTKDSISAKQLNEVVGKMDPSKTDYLEVAAEGQGGPFLEEHAEEIVHALKLFLQGAGFVTNIGLLTSKLKGTVGGKELLKQTSLLEFGSDITVEI